jgi:MoxR-like ATPase
VAARLVAGVEQVVHGRRRQVELVVCAVLAGGHVLVEDVPGSGKTTLARAVAQCLGGTFRRIQGTADLLPSDITGSGVWEPDRHAFAFVPGPVFGHVVLVDELNRTPPRTQSAFLEAMDEGAVTVDGVRHPLPDPFVVLATQNPLEQYGTYPLPEAQLDRFAVTLTLGTNDPATERLVVREQLDHATVGELVAVTTPEQLAAVRKEVRRTHVADAVLDHAVRVVEATRSHPGVLLGASTRAALTLVHCAQSRALLAGRDHVTPDDVKALAAPVLGHRLVLRDGSGGLSRGQQLVAELLAAVPVPLAT